jgi:Tol biopolymer transport system component
MEDSDHPRIFVMNSDGSHRFALTSSGEYASPAWSPNGRQIEYEGIEGEQTSSTPLRIFRMNADGSDARGVTSDGSDHYRLSNSWAPAWKPAP